MKCILRSHSDIIFLSVYGAERIKTEFLFSISLIYVRLLTLLRAAAVKRENVSLYFRVCNLAISIFHFLHVFQLPELHFSVALPNHYVSQARFLSHLPDVSQSRGVKFKVNRIIPFLKS